LTDLINMVKAAGADLGVAHDGDADRVAFVDETGEFLDEEDLLALMAGHVLDHISGKVVTPVGSSLKIKDVTESKGSELVWTRVGSIDVARKMIEIGAVFGGEGNGGLIFPEFLYCRDGAMTAAKMLELLAEGNKLSELKKSIPKYHNFKAKINIANPVELMNKVGKAVKGQDIDNTDGIKIWYPDGWILIRPSGTEPLIRIFAESKSEDRARELLDFGSNLVNDCNAN
ncbi:MAG: hypothetical protein MUO40_04255, partial [Anaerolineaceae bacterium]|nr:hypothetical protein [Anaerolineaceae bacterium]